MRRRALALLLVCLACTEDPTAPGTCPAFCPPGEITLVDTTLTSVVVRDSAFRGYVEPEDGAVLIGANVPGRVDSRPIMRFQRLGTTVRLGTDTTNHPIIGTDSALFALAFFRRDTSAGDLIVRIYRLPHAVDTAATFGSLAGAFNDSLLRTINLDSLIRLPLKRDPVTGDSVQIVDSLTVRLLVRLDSAQARFIAADSGQLAMGVRIQADSATSVLVGSNESGDLAFVPLITWHVRVDSAGTTTRAVRAVAPEFDSYVFDPPPLAIDSTLAVGGMPSSRSVLRIMLPPRLQDSVQILRATLLLVPAVVAQGAAIDTFTLVAHAVSADLGGKSPLITNPTNRADSSFFGVAPIVMGSTDTVRIEITRILRRWAADTAAPTTIVLHSASEGVVMGEIRFQPSRHPTLRPIVRLTYANRFPFGSP